MAEIRRATFDDVATIAALGELMALESPRFSQYPYQTERAAQTLESLINAPMGCVVVALHDGLMVGFLAAAAFPHYACDFLQASDLAFFIHPDYRGGTSAARLVRFYVRWATGIGAEPTIGINTGVTPDRTADLLTALGAKHSGTNWTWGI